MKALNLASYRMAQNLIGQGRIDFTTPWQDPADPSAVTAFLCTDEGTPCCPVGTGGLVYASALSRACQDLSYDDPCYQMASKLRDQMRAVSFAESQAPVAVADSESDWVEVFRAGDYPQGEFTETDLDTIASGYSPEFHEAPATVDHSHDGPAYGWVSKVKKAGDVLMVKFKQMASALKRADGVA